MTKAITITFPGTPVYELSPNARTHYMVKSRAVKDAKLSARWAIMEWQVCPIDGPVELDWTIRLAKRRKPLDRDNLITTLKPYMDALVDGGVIEDDKPSIVTRIGITDQIGWAKHKIDGGEIEVTITSAEQGR